MPDKEEWDYLNDPTRSQSSYTYQNLLQERRSLIYMLRLWNTRAVVEDVLYLLGTLALGAVLLYLTWKGVLS